ncbi:MAG: glutamine--fructose-6-phosphate transaminase (isomerizing) [Armatimonadota bacterium]
MCGIVGYIGKKQVIPILLNGLKLLEYRGYDSSGVAVYNGNHKIQERKSLGKLIELENLLKGLPLKGSLGIGHTRWATHGKPSDMNAHPHLDCRGKIAVVHNGIIENFLPLQNKLEKRGHKFKSETDTEILAHLIEDNYTGSIEKAVRKALKQVRGSYALGVICVDEPDKIVAARKDSPLIIGIGKHENYIASDIPAFLSHTKRALLLYDEEIAVITKDSVKITDLNGKIIARKSFAVSWSQEQASKGGYKHFMLKEIYEQPKITAETLSGRLRGDMCVDLEHIKLNKNKLKKINRIFMSACGTAYHAALIGKYIIEEITKIPCEVDLASEFRYRKPVLDKKTLFIPISQSGETADTLAATREAKRLGAHTLAICNVMGSSLSRETHDTLYTRAGIEIGVAATKTFIAQLIAIYLLAFHIAQELSIHYDRKYLKELYKLPNLMEKILGSHDEIKKWARKYHNRFNFLYLGRGLNYPIALEGALKLKEISYMHAEGYAAGEMKHGPIALIDKHVPVVGILTKNPTYDKIVNNVKEVNARGGILLALATEKDIYVKTFADYVYYLPKTVPLFDPILNVIPLQLLAYYIADIKKRDVDQPRNLAKSVTVE